MHQRGLGLLVLGLVAAATGCYAHDGYGYGYTTVSAQPTYVAPAPVHTEISASVSASPDLVSVTPGVQVIANYHEPIFYSAGYYWREYDGGWYRSSSYSGGWSHYHDGAPYAVRSLPNRGYYRNYRPAGYVSRGHYDRGHVGYDRRGYNRAGYDRGYNRGYERPVVRDYRGANRGYERRGHDNRAPVVRDHRSGGNYRGTSRSSGRDYRRGSRR
jgi:hypothetical protein